MENTDEEYVVARDGQGPSSSDPQRDKSVDLESGLAELQMAVDLMTNNQYHQAVKLLKPKSGISMYHSMAYGTVLFIQAGFGMEREAIESATEVLTKTVELCNSVRRPRGMMESLSGWMFGQRLDGYTPTELQAEVFYAEANLLLSFLTFLQDESLMSFVKGGLRIRSCHSTYKQLYQWLVTCQEEGLQVEPNFATGVRMGYGCFNLFLSLLPARIIKLLEFIGFSVDREVGLVELQKASESPTFRGPLCSSFLLFYYTVAAVISGIELDADQAEQLLRPQLEKYPNAVQFLYFKGRVSAMRGDINKAIECFQAAIDAQTEWRQVCHLCWWELAWAHGLKSEWSLAAEYSDKLCTESKWSKATFLYMKTCFLLMQKDFNAADQPQSSVASEEELADMMRKIPSLKQRIAGKSLPMEKFAVAKSERYLAGSPLPLCGMELLYGHNLFLLLARNQPLLQQLLQQVWTKLLELEKNKEDNLCYHDDWAVVTLLQGCVFRVLERYDEAEKCLLDVIDREAMLKHDLYTVPAAHTELGLLYIATGKLLEAQRRLETARTNYKGYHLESRIHFWIHAGMNRIKNQQTAK